MMKNFLDYVSKLDSNFRERIRGASLDEITRLEHLAGFPLPEIYKDFLVYMGHNDGWLKIMPAGTTDISEIISYYEEMVIPGHEKFPENCLMFGRGEYPEYDLALKCDSSIDAPQVFFMEDGELVSLYADSFEKLLFRIAFRKYSFQHFQHFRAYTDSNAERRLIEAETLARELGYKCQWFSDSIEICADKNDVSLLITQYYHSGIAVVIYSSSESELEKIGSMFAERMSVSRQK